MNLRTIFHSSVFKMFSIVLSLLFLCSLHAQSHFNSNVANSISQVFPTEKDIEQTAKTGVSKSTITNEFGSPTLAGNLNEPGTSFIAYIFTPHFPKSESEFDFSGFEIFFRNEKVVAWRSLYEIHPMIEIQTQHATRLTTNIQTGNFESNSLDISNKLNFFIVSETPIQNGRYVDTKKLPHLGYVSTMPNLSISRLNALEELNTEVSSGGSNKKKFGVVLHLGFRDSKIFKDLTTQNIGKRMLMEIGEKPIIAPYITGPIDSGMLSIETFNEEDYETMFQSIKTLPVYAQ